MAEPQSTHFLEYFFEGLKTEPEQPLFYERNGAIFHHITRRDTATRISEFARALYAAGITPESRVAFCATASIRLWLGEWGVLASRGVAVILPHDFGLEHCIETLAESKSKLVIVGRLEFARKLAEAFTRLPDLKHILCFEGSNVASIPILSWNEFLELGAGQPDRSAALVRAVAAKDTALLFYSLDTGGRLQATRYTHALLLEHAGKIATILGTHMLRKDEMVMGAIAWEHILGHITSCYMPLLKKAAIEIAGEKADIDLLENGPQILVAEGSYFDALKQQVLNRVELLGSLERKEMRAVLALGKAQYEKASMWPWQRIKYFVLKNTIVRKVHKMLGGRLRVLICVDDTAHYETQLFFHTFGVELTELPPDIFK